MIINCKDNSNGKLLLAVDFISFLCETAKQVSITCSTNEMQLYAGLQKLFNNLAFKTETSSQYNVVFSDSPDSAEYADIIYPIVKVVDTAWNSIPNFVPLESTSTKKIAGYFVGEISSAKLLIQKSMTAQTFKDQKILISAGPTAEDIDPVRFLTNRSTGKMGIELAKAAYIKGADVELILGPGGVTAPTILKTTHIRSAEEMAKMVITRLPEMDIYIGSAAIADYTPRSKSIHKIKKQPADLNVELSRTTDVLKTISKIRTKQKIVGFSVETQQEINNSKKKLIEKDLDMIVINNPIEKGSGFGTDTNRVTVLLKNGQIRELPMQTKQQLSAYLLDMILEIEPFNA